MMTDILLFIIICYYLLLFIIIYYYLLLFIINYCYDYDYNDYLLI